MKRFDTALYFITDSTGYEEAEFLWRLEAALCVGVTILHLREKNKSTREMIALAQKVHALTQKYRVPMLVDDRVDVALAVDAEGVHLGAEDMTVALARKILGENKIIGATAKTVPWAKDVTAQGADYLGVGAIFPTTTKVKTVLTSTDTLCEICRAVPIPVNAIGGLNQYNIDILSGIPIAGICAVSAIMKAKDPKKAAEALKEKTRKLGLI